MSKRGKTKALCWMLGSVMLVLFSGCPPTQVAASDVVGTWHVHIDPECDGSPVVMIVFSLYGDGTVEWGRSGQLDGSWSMTGNTLNVWVFEGMSPSFYTGVLQSGTSPLSMEGTSRNTLGSTAWCWTGEKQS
jgi:hypothetical protein